MLYRELGRSGIKVSAVGFGAWAIGGWMWGGADENQAVEAIHAALDRGVNLIDTAPVYGFGRSEEIVGRAIRGRRESVVLATKCGLVWDREQGDFFFHANDEGVTLRPSVKKVYKCLRPESIRDWGRGYGFGWWPWAYWPGAYYGYYGGWGYPYYSYYPDYSYYPNYSSNPCYPYGPYDCRISGYGPVSYAPSPVSAGQDPAEYSQRYSSPEPYPQTSTSPVTRTAYLGDGQWHHFGPQPAPAIRAASAGTVPRPSAGEPVRTYNASLSDGQWHRFGPKPAPSERDSSPPIKPHSQASEPLRTYKVSLTDGM